MKLPGSPSARRSAFTLLEICISVGVVLLLAVLAIPIFSSINASKNSIKCMEHQRTLYMAMLAFIEDHQGKLPPPLGPATEVHPRFTFNSYWYSHTLLGNYAAIRSQSDRSKRLSQAEAEVFNCPARLVDGPDSEWVVGHSGNPAVSYLMVNPGNYSFRAIEEKSKRPFLLEGRFSTIWSSVCKTGTPGIRDSTKRLRRYHQGGMNILYYDGHIEFFNGPDSAIAARL